MGIDRDFPAKYSFLLSELVAIREQADDEGEILPDKSIIYLRGGETAEIDIPYAKLEDQWETYLKRPYTLNQN